MFRSLFFSKRLLQANPVPLNFNRGLISLYDVRCSSHNTEFHRPLPLAFPPVSVQHPRPILLNTRSVSSSGFQVPNPSQVACNFINMTKCIDLNNLKDAPPPTFWVVAATAASMLGIPFLELIGGYSPILTYTQLYIAAMTLAFNGGQKWGLAVSSNPVPPPTWETMGWSLLPPGFGIVALILPYPLGFATMAVGLLTSLYFDLKSCVYPPWGTAATYFMTLSSVVGLLLGLVAYTLFHNKENSKKKSKEQRQSPEEEEAVESAPTEAPKS